MSINTISIENKQNNIIARIVTGIVIAIGFYAVFFLWGDIQSVKEVFRSIPLRLFLLSIACTLLSYGFRFLKWHYYLIHLNIKVGVKDSLYIFFIGLSMSITPGKIGELLKAYLLKQVGEVEMAHSAPAVFVDRLTDLFAMLLLVGVGISFFPIGYLSFIVVLIGLVSITLVLQSPKVSLALIHFFTENRFMKKHRNSIIKLYKSTHKLTKVKPFTFTIFLSVIAWFMECISLYIIIQSLGIELELIKNIFIFSFGTVAGALSMLPGGLGVAEASITGMLMYFGITKAVAVSITLLIRLVTLWLGVIIGLCIFFIQRKRYMI